MLASVCAQAFLLSSRQIFRHAAVNISDVRQAEITQWLIQWLWHLEVQVVSSSFSSGKIFCHSFIPYTPCEFFTPALADGFFYWRLSDSKFPHVSRTLLTILTDLNTAEVWIVSSSNFHFFQPSFQAFRDCSKCTN